MLMCIEIPPLSRINRQLNPHLNDEHYQSRIIYTKARLVQLQSVEDGKIPHFLIFHLMHQHLVYLMSKGESIQTTYRLQKKEPFEVNSKKQ